MAGLAHGDGKSATEQDHHAQDEAPAQTPTPARG